MLHQRPICSRHRCSAMIFFMAVPIWAGDLTTVTPAASRALILSVAVPLPPEMMAPAWPILLPGGAVSPAQVSESLAVILVVS